KAKHGEDDCQQTVAQLQAANAQLVHTQKEQAAKARELIEKLNAAEARIEECQCHVKELKEKLAAAACCAEELKAAQNTIAAQGHRIEELNCELAASCKQVEKLRHEKAQTVHEAERLNEENCRLKADLQGAGAMIQGLKTANAELHEKVHCCEEKLAQTVC